MNQQNNREDKETIEHYFNSLNDKLVTKIQMEEMKVSKLNQISSISNKVDRASFNIQQLVFNVAFMTFLTFLAINSFKQG